MVLNSEPTANVTILLASSDPDDGTPGETTLVFTPADWDTPQTVTVTGEDDELDDDDQPYTIELEPATSDDENYEGEDGTDVSFTNTDNDPVPIPGITVTPTSGLLVSDDGNNNFDSFEIVLDSEPTDDVTIDLTVIVGVNAVFVSPSSVVFTPLDWETPQTVRVISDVDGNHTDDPFTVDLLPAESLDPAYATFDGGQVTGSEIDDSEP